MFSLITYDIESDKLRAKVAKALEGHGERVQYSVFECNLTKPQLQKLKKRLAGIMKKAPDEEVWSIRFYFLCAACVRSIDILGEGTVTRDADFYIV